MQLFAEPTRTRYDLHFTVRGIPVRVHPWFWIATILLSLNKDFSLLSFAIWLPVVFMSILIHELGHAWAYVRFGHHPRICMHGMGGLAIVDEALGRETPRREIIIAAAGPVAGFLLGGLVMLALVQLGYRVDLLGFPLIDGLPIESLPVWLLVQQLLAINLVWGAVNLLPVHPLDGSHIFYHLFFARDLARGQERSVRMSFLVAVTIALVGLFFRSTFVAILFAYLAFVSWQLLQQLGAPAFVTPRPFRRVRSKWRALAHEVEHQQRVRELRAVDKKLEQNLEQVDLAEGADADIARTADELLARLNAEIVRERKQRK